EDAKKLKSITENGLVGILANKLSQSSTTKRTILRLLSMLCSASESLALNAFKEGVLSVITGILAPQQSFFSRDLTLDSLSATDQILYDALYLLNKMLPAIKSPYLVSVESI